MLDVLKASCSLVKELAAPIDSAADVYPFLVFDKFLHLLVVSSTRQQQVELHYSAEFSDALEGIRIMLKKGAVELQSVTFQSKAIVDQDAQAYFSRPFWTEGEGLQRRWDRVDPPDYNARFAELFTFGLGVAPPVN